MRARNPTVALVGRQNVGKSSLFNTLSGAKNAVVSVIPGTTRDRTEAQCTWRGRSYTLVDSGGMEEKPRSSLEQSVTNLALQTAHNSDLVLFIVDGQDGVTREDRAIARFLRTLKKPIALVINKIDNARQRQSIPFDAYRMGFKNIALVSAKTGAGTGDLLDFVADNLPNKTSFETEVPVRCVLLGKPNVGKSSLMNALTGTMRSLTHSEPHTTRDPQHAAITIFGKDLILTDTAGFRRAIKLSKPSSSAETAIEQESVSRALLSLRTADVAALVLDATEPATFQDRHLAENIRDTGTGTMIVINKTDMLSRRARHWQTLTELKVRRSLPFLSWAPALFVSAKTGSGVKRILTVAQTIARSRRQHITDEQLQTFLFDAMKKKRPPVGINNKRPRLIRLTQHRTAPPVFHLEIAGKQKPPQSYVRYIENALRQRFNFTGVPIAVSAEGRKRL